MPVIGIDLGTSNTCVGVVLDGRPQVILDEKGRSTLPSVMALNRRGQFFVGHLAKAQMSINPTGTVHSAKRLLGQKYSGRDVQRLIPELPFEISQLPDDSPGIKLGDNVLTPTEVSAAVLKKVKVLAENALNEPITNAVISVPAHFDNFQRRETKHAAEIAGLEVSRLINEPTAAALAYGYGANTPGMIAVFDFGGGTFDISILEIGDGIYNVLATGGDTFLGGNDFNNAVAHWAAERFNNKYHFNPMNDIAAHQRLLDASEYVKILLSTQEKAQLTLQQVLPDIDPSWDLDETLTRSQLETLCAPLVERALNICQQTFDSANISIADINDIIMVGGMTRMPLVRRRVTEWFGRAPNTTINPDEAVGIGAAIQAMALDSIQDNMVLLLDVLPLTLSIEAAGGVCIPVIAKNTKIPHHVSRIFTTSRDNQNSVTISIYQGEGHHISENSRLSTFELTGIRQAPRMTPRIEVSFSIDVNGILSVTAIDLDSHQSQSIEIVDLTAKALDVLESEPIVQPE